MSQTTSSTESITRVREKMVPEALKKAVDLVGLDLFAAYSGYTPDAIRKMLATNECVKTIEVLATLFLDSRNNEKEMMFFVRVPMSQREMFIKFLSTFGFKSVQLRDW